MCPRVLVFAALLGSVVACPTVAAPDGKAADKSAQQARRLQQQLRAAEKEKGEIAAQKAALEADLKAARGEADAARAGVAREARRASALDKSLAQLREEKAGLERDLVAEKESRAALERQKLALEREAAAQRAEGLRERERFEAISARQLALLTASRERNEKMYKLGLELVQRWESKTCSEAMLQAEPFTGLKRAQIERMAEADRETFDRDRLPVEQESPRYAPVRSGEFSGGARPR